VSSVKWLEFLKRGNMFGYYSLRMHKRSGKFISKRQRTGVADTLMTQRQMAISMLFIGA